MKVVSLVGTRPQFIKEAVLHKTFKDNGIDEILVHSGQHYDANMSDVFFKVLDIRQPHYNLNVGSGTHGELTGKTMIAFEKVALREKTNVILVYGDSDTTLAGALVGAKLKIPIAHVEAGVRQQPKDMPEEINRVVTDHVSSLLFCPSALAVKNLKREGITAGVHFTGDVMYELYLKMTPYFDFSLVKKLGLTEEEYIVCTIHRDFNTDNQKTLRTIINQLETVSRQMQVIFPIHPRTRKRMQEFGLKVKDILVIEPVDYLKMMGLVKLCRLVITDSGGLQKEAYYAGKRSVVVMPDTGWRELVQTGWNKLSRADNIARTTQEMLNDEHALAPQNMYGDGHCSKKIAEILNRTYTKY